MKRSSEIVVPVLNDEYKVVVLISKKTEYILKKLNYWRYEVDMRYVENALDKRGGATFSKEGCYPVIAVWDLSKPAQIGTLAHEAAHAIFYIFDKIGEHCYNEVFCHSVGAVVREVMKKAWVE